MLVAAVEVLFNLKTHRMSSTRICTILPLGSPHHLQGSHTRTDLKSTLYSVLFPREQPASLGLGLL